jgi:methylglyoxal/glyoxal reductase
VNGQKVSFNQLFMSTPSLIKLSNGYFIPRVGLGTYEQKGLVCKTAVAAALKCGYRLIDTASVYRNEVEVGEAIKESGIAREDIFVTTKLAPNDHGEKAYAAVKESLARLELSYVDLVLVHWPGVKGLQGDDERLKGIRRTTWLMLQKLYDEKLVRSLGVSNYLPHHLEDFYEPHASEWNCVVKPVVNQFELHPLLVQDSLIKYCEDHAIQVEAYASLARGDARLLAHPTIVKVARRYGKTSAQICLKWALQRGWIVIPKSNHVERIEGENSPAVLEGSGWVIADEDMREINEMQKEEPLRTCWDPTSIRK